LCALPLGRVVETMRRLPVEPLAGAPPFVSGISIVRGGSVPVVELAALVGVAAPPASMLVTVTVGGDPERHIALAVSAVVGVRTISQQALTDFPPLLTDVRPEVLTALGVLDAQTLLVLETVHILPDSVWAELPARAQPVTASREAAW
jgi:purine-binding chemotaxis protein CheW